MRQRLVQVFQVPQDLDYVESFQDLSVVNHEIRTDGPTVERLLRKALLERAIGNHGAGLGAVQQALKIEPDNAEARYELGRSYFFLALARAGAVPVGLRTTELPPEGVEGLLGLAVEAFSQVVALNPQDVDAMEELAALAEVLAVGADDAQLAAALRDR